MGEIVGAVGLRGEVKVLVNGSFDEEVLHSDFLRRRGRAREGEGVAVRCSRHRWKGGTVIVSLDDVTDRNAAEAAVGQQLGFRAADYDEPGFPRRDGTPAWMYLDLMVVTVEGREIGRVDDVLTLPANWVLRVLVHEGEPDEHEVLVPVIDPVIRSVDREAQRVVIDPLPGLLDGFESA